MAMVYRHIRSIVQRYSRLHQPILKRLLDETQPCLPPVPTILFVQSSVDNP